jgi:hypothetical protein
VVEIIKGEPEIVFVNTTYEIETGEAERVAVDHASKSVSATAETGSNSGREFSLPAY